MISASPAVIGGTLHLEKAEMMRWIKKIFSRDVDRELDLLVKDRDELFVRHQEAISECDRLLERARKAEEKLEEAEKDGVWARNIAESRLRQLQDTEEQVEKLMAQVESLSAENLEVRGQLEVSRDAFDAIGEDRTPGG